MARPKKPDAAEVVVHVNEEQLAADVRDVNTLALANSIADAEKDEVLAAGIDIGRLEAMDFVVTVTTSAILAVFENVKKSKAWKHLRNPKSGHGDHFQSLEEFCEVKLGKSYERLRKIVANRNVIGQEAFEQAERLGLRQVDYNAIKALPAPEQELLRRAVEEAKSREEVLDVLQELAGRFAKTEADLQAKVFDLQDEAEAKDKVLAEKSARLDKAQQDLAKAKKRIASATPDEALQQMQREATDILNDARGCIQGALRAALGALHEQGGSNGGNGAFMAGMVAQVKADAEELRREFGLPEVDASTDLDWLNLPAAQPQPKDAAPQH